MPDRRNGATTPLGVRAPSLDLSQLLCVLGSPVLLVGTFTTRRNQRAVLVDPEEQPVLSSESEPFAG